MEHESESDTNYNWRARNHPKQFGKKDWEVCKSEDASTPSKLQHFLDQPEYREEFWRPGETCCN